MSNVDWASHDAGRDVWVLRLLVQPGAGKNVVVGEHGGRLKLKIAAPAVDNRANTCLVAYLAELTGITRSKIKIIRGETGKQKAISIAGSGPFLPEIFRVHMDRRAGS